MANSNVPLIFQPLVRYVDFNGRSRRSEYWLWALFLFLVNAALSVLQFSMMGANMAAMQSASHSDAAMAANMGTGMIIGLIRLVVGLGLILPSIAVAVRRMHDINRTGWWIVLPNTVFVIALIVVISLTGADFMKQISHANANSGDTSAMMGFVFSMLRAFMWVLLPTLAAKVVTFVFRVTEGTRGPNRYGPDPKGSAPTNVF